MDSRAKLEEVRALVAQGVVKPEVFEQLKSVTREAETGQFLGTLRTITVNFPGSISGPLGLFFETTDTGYAMVTGMPEGPAAGAGVHECDVVVEVNGAAVAGVPYDVLVQRLRQRPLEVKFGRPESRSEMQTYYGSSKAPKITHSRRSQKKARAALQAESDTVSAVQGSPASATGCGALATHTITIASSGPVGLGLRESATGYPVVRTTPPAGSPNKGLDVRVGDVIMSVANNSDVRANFDTVISWIQHSRRPMVITIGRPVTPGEMAMYHGTGNSPGGAPSGGPVPSSASGYTAGRGVSPIRRQPPNYSGGAGGTPAYAGTSGFPPPAQQYPGAGPPPQQPYGQPPQQQYAQPQQPYGQPPQQQYAQPQQQYAQPQQPYAQPQQQYAQPQQQYAQPQQQYAQRQPQQQQSFQQPSPQQSYRQPSQMQQLQPRGGAAPPPVSVASNTSPYGQPPVAPPNSYSPVVSRPKPPPNKPKTMGGGARAAAPPPAAGGMPPATFAQQSSMRAAGMPAGPRSAAAPSAVAAGGGGGLAGFLQGIGVDPTTAGMYAQALANDGFDTVSALAIAEESDLEAAGIKRGHRLLILRNR